MQMNWQHLSSKEMKRQIKTLVNEGKTVADKKAIIEQTLKDRGYKVKVIVIEGKTAKVTLL